MDNQTELDQQPVQPLKIPSSPDELNDGLHGAVRGVTRFGPRAVGIAIVVLGIFAGTVLYGFQKGPSAAVVATIPQNAAPPAVVTNAPAHFGALVSNIPTPGATVLSKSTPPPVAKVPNIQQKVAPVDSQPRRDTGSVTNLQNEARDRIATAREALRNAQRNEADSAIKSPILINEASNTGAAAASGIAGRLVSDNAGAGGGLGTRSSGHSYLDGPNGQFSGGNDGTRSADILPSQREAPISRYEIIASSVIPATLISSIDTDHPGIISALVRQNMYDSLTGHYMLIPQGSRLLGVYEASVQNGQSRVTVAWNRLIFPDTSSIDLVNMVGADVQGSSGFGGKVDNHFGAVLKVALLSTVLSIGASASSPQTGSLIDAPTFGNTASQSAAQQIQKIGGKLVADAAAVPPTIHVTRGYPCNVIVDRDITFRAPYTPQI